ncbi:MAG TPA: Hpt domain-containing protein [Nitrospira sp.]|nr:Hpt domain-containing protein [Nitrospira sp.]
MTQRLNGTGRDKVIVYVDPDLEDIVPGFLENRRKDADTLEAALQRNDLKTIRLLGHRMKGDGGGFGFEEISTIGDALEQAAIREDRVVIKRQTAALVDYLTHVDVVYRR